MKCFKFYFCLDFSSHREAEQGQTRQQETMSFHRVDWCWTEVRPLPARMSAQLNPRLSSWQRLRPAGARGNLRNIEFGKKLKKLVAGIGHGRLIMHLCRRHGHFWSHKAPWGNIIICQPATPIRVYTEANETTWVRSVMQTNFKILYKQKIVFKIKFV